MFNHFDRSKEKQILDKLDVLSPPLSEIIRKHLFTFEDVFALDDRSIQSVMREVSNDTLTLAMKTSPDEVKEKIFKNISSRAADMIKEDLRSWGRYGFQMSKRRKEKSSKSFAKWRKKGKSFWLAGEVKMSSSKIIKQADNDSTGVSEFSFRNIVQSVAVVPVVQSTEASCRWVFFKASTSRTQRRKWRLIPDRPH